LQFYIARLEREKGKRTKCLTRIAAYHLGEKHARSVDIVNAKKLVEHHPEYRKLNQGKNFSPQAIIALKNEISFLNDCLRIAIEKYSSGEFIDLLELEKLENSIKEKLLMKEKVVFDDLPRIDSFSRGTRFRRKEKLSIFDKMIFGKFSKGYLKAEYLKPGYNDLIIREGKQY